MSLDSRDLDRLQRGEPPLSDYLLDNMTVGDDVWLGPFKSHYLDNYIRHGGSKVKVLIGSEGTGKSHLLRCAQADARAVGFETVYLSARDGIRLNDIQRLYGAIVHQIDKERLIQGLCCRVAEELGYDATRYDGTGSLLPTLVEEEHGSRPGALRQLRSAIGSVFGEVDVGPSFVAFAGNVISQRMTGGNPEGVQPALKWLSGGKLERSEKQTAGLFERLQKTNARYWLNGLIRLLTLSGRTGLVVIIDDLELVTERDPRTGKFHYAPNAVKDLYELFRQVIDDAELVSHLVLLLAGRPSLLEDPRRGFTSYEALWMRLQTGLVPTERFNPFADMVDVNLHLANCGLDAPRRASDALDRLLQTAGLKRSARSSPAVYGSSELRACVMETAHCFSLEGE